MVEIPAMLSNADKGNTLGGAAAGCIPFPSATLLLRWKQARMDVAAHYSQWAMTPACGDKLREDTAGSAPGTRVL